MKKNRLFIDKKKILPFIFMWLCWFLPDFYLHFESYQYEKLKQGLIFIFIMTVSTVCYYLINNNAIKAGVFFASVVGVTFALGIKLALAVYPMFFVIFIYKNSLTEKTKNSFESLSEILLFISPVALIIAILFNFKTFILPQNILLEPIFTGVVFIAFFAFLLKFCGSTKDLTKGQKKLCQLVYITVIISVLTSVISFNTMLNNSVSFFPYMLFITLMVLEEDIVLWRSADLLVDGIKKFAS